MVLVSKSRRARYSGRLASRIAASGKRCSSRRSSPATASSRRCSSIVTPAGVGNSGKWFWPSEIVRLQRCAMATEFASASGRSANFAAMSAVVAKYCSRRESSRAARVGEYRPFGDAHARLVRAKILARQKLRRMRGDDRQGQLARERDGSGDQRVVVGMTGTLHLEVIALRKPRRPFAGRARRGRGIALQQRVADVAVARAGKRDQAVGPFGEPFAPQLGMPAVLVGAVGARQPRAEFQVAVAGGRQKDGAKRTIALRVVRDPHVAADDGLQARAARRLVELDEAERVGQVGKSQRGHPVAHRRGHRVVDPDRAVDDRVFAVQPQVDEGRNGHFGGVLDW